MATKIVERILREAGLPDLLEVLAERLSPTDLQSLMLEVYRRRAEQVTPAGLLRRYEQDRFVQPSGARAGQLLGFDLLATSLLPSGFEVLELSPVCPLGSNSALAPLHQNRVVSTSRNSEVCADSTSVLALECARRRRDAYRNASRLPAETRLCASQRVLRAQQFEGPVSFAHFRLLSLCTAGRDRGSYRFETAALVEHVDYYLRLFQASTQAGFTLGPVRATLTTFETRLESALGDQVLEPLAARYPEVAFDFDPERHAGNARLAGHGYYTGVRFQIFAAAGTAGAGPAGAEYLLVDGGFVDWTQQLLSNRKERLLTSGLGSERFVVLFGYG